MITKLIRVDDVYRLVEVTKHGNSIIGTTDLDYQKTWSDRCQRLSLKNCQAVEHDYDLDELAISTYPFDSKADVINAISQQAYIKGFQKCLEILGDKKFSEEDMVSAIIQARDVDELTDILWKRFRKGIDEIIDSLQQTEWDVEIMVDICGDKVYAVPEFRLDGNDCLILKRI